MNWLNNVTWPKAVLLGVVILIVTRMVAPDVAAWILAPIVNLTSAAFEMLRTTMGG